MQIVCKRKGGIGLPGVELKFGSNSVEPAAWEAAKAKLDPAWLAAMLEPGDDGAPAEIVVVDSAPPPMAAKAKVAMVESAETIDEINALSRDETRKTVLAAIDKRLKALGEAFEE